MNDLTTIAVCGSAKALRRNVVMCLEKVTEEYEHFKLLVEMPAGVDYNTMAAGRHAIDWARNCKVPFHLAMPTSFFDAAATEYAEAVLAEAVDTTTTVNIARLLQAGDVMILAFDDQDDEAMNALVVAKKRGVRVFDADGSELVLGPEEEDEEDDFFEGEFPTVYITDAIEREVRAMMSQFQDRILELVEREVKKALESKTRIRTAK